MIKVSDLGIKFKMGKRQRSRVFTLLFERSHNRQQRSGQFWALRHVNFNVEHGDTVGIIGRNGAGKTTLLKILSQITYPTKGEVILRGRVGSLLEVGTGFHPELTGRENIYLNGAILNMKKREIDDKFEEIVKFAGTKKFLDTPVKDTTGAGDAFQGGFIFGHLNGWSIEQCSVLANACGYLKSLNVGARNMPRRELVEKFLTDRGFDFFNNPN